MVVHIQGGKGRKDWDVMLSPVLLEALREHWRGLKPKTWLFPGVVAYGPRSDHFQTIWHACDQAALRAGLDNRVHPHTLGDIASPLPICSKRVRTCARSS